MLQLLHRKPRLSLFVELLQLGPAVQLHKLLRGTCDTWVGRREEEELGVIGHHIVSVTAIRDADDHAIRPHLHELTQTFDGITFGEVRKVFFSQHDAQGWIEEIPITACRHHA